MIKVIVVALLVASALSLSVDLERQSIQDIQFVKSGTSFVKAATQEKGDWIYTYEAKVNGNDAKVFFDTTVSESYHYNKDAEAPTGTTQVINAADSRGQLTNAQSLEQSIEFDHEKLKGDIYTSKTLGANDNTNIYDAASYGFGLNRDSDKNFFNTLEKSKVKLEHKGFSFYYSPKVNQLILGNSELFFSTTNKLEQLNAKVSSTDKTWSVPLKSKGVSLEDQSALDQSAATTAVFDTTTRYIWAEDKLVKSIVDKLQCNEVDANNKTGLYNCKTSDVPALLIQFQNKDSESSEDSKVYKIKNYVEKINDDEYRLLIRKNTYYAASADKVPSVIENSTTARLVLGTVFLENVYTYFNYENHSVNLGEAYTVHPQDRQIDSTYRLWYLILGSLLMVALLVFILSLLKKVPPHSPVVQVPAQQVTTYAPTSTYVQAPVYSYQAPIQQTTLSPQRVVSSGYVPQQYVVRQQQY